MLYANFMKNVKELVISYDEEAMVHYLEPDWVTILHENNLADLESIQDMYIDGWYDLEDVLKLEVERRNAIASKKNLVYNWLYDLITSTIDPAMVEEENNLVQNMLELAKARNTESESNKEPEENG